MQAVQRSRELLVHERVSLSNHFRGLLMDFGIVIPQGFASLYRRLPEILEDGENELPERPPGRKSSARDHHQIEDIRSGKTCSAMRPLSPSTLRGTGVRIH